MQKMAMEQKRQRCEHVLHILQQELAKEVERQQGAPTPSSCSLQSIF